MQVDKQRFSYLLNNYRSLTDKETVKLIALQRQFPYSQAIRNITTWGTYHNNLPTRKTQLYIATLYATNQKLFKTLITAPRVERKITPRAKKTTVPQATHNLKPAISEQIKDPQRTVPTTSQVNEILNRLPDELLNLKENRLNFEQTIKSLEDNAKPDNKSIQKAPVGLGGNIKKNAPRKIAKKSVIRKKTVKKILTKKKVVRKKPSQKKTIKKIVKKIPKITQKKLSTAKKKTSKKTPKKVILGKQQSLKKSSSKKIVPKKKSTKKTISKKKIAKKRPRAQKKGQQKIIKNFIQSEPKEPTTNPKTVKLNDLSETSHTLNKHAISETLVQVLIAQGKKNEAIEILKKLIWKIPQKKELFIAQIKALKPLS